MSTPRLSDYTRSIEHDRAAHSAVLYAKALATGQMLFDVPDPHIEGIKTAMTGMTSTNAAALRQQIFGAYLALVNAPTVVGQLNGTTPAPPGTPLIGLRNSGPDADWIADGEPIPLARLDLNAPRTAIAKFGVLIAFSREIAKLNGPRAERLFEAQLTRPIRRAQDALFLGTSAAVEGMRPEGLLYGLTSLGITSPMQLDSDLVDLWTSVVEGEALSPYFVTSPRGAMYLAMQHDDGAPRFPHLGPKGGDIAGVPVLTSRAAGNKLVLLAAEHLVITDEGLEIERSDEAVVEMSDGPSMNITTPTAATVVSAWQANATVLRVIRYLHWSKMRGDCAAYLELPIGGSPA